MVSELDGIVLNLVKDLTKFGWIMLLALDQNSILKNAIAMIGELTIVGIVKMHLFLVGQVRLRKYNISNICNLFCYCQTKTKCLQ